MRVYPMVATADIAAVVSTATSLRQWCADVLAPAVRR